MTASPHRAIDALADSYVDEIAVLDPLLATYAGIPGHDHEMPDLSPAGLAAVNDLHVRTLAALRDLEPVDERERVAKEAMQERLGLEVEMYDAGLTQILRVLASPMQGVREVFDLMPTEGAEAWSNIAIRLALVPGALDGYRATLLDEAARGRVPSKRQVLSCAEQCRRWTSGDSPFFPGLIAGADNDAEVDESLRARLAESSAAAAAAYEAFGKFLTEEFLPLARDKDAFGRDTYQLASRYFLGATVDLEETYAWGWQELARLGEEQNKVADQIVPGGTVLDAKAALDADESRRLVGTDALQRWMQELSDRAVAGLADTHFDIPEPIRRLDCRIAPTHDGGIYYTGPSEDLSRPGSMWWSVPEGVESFQTWEQTTTVYHEGVPGHHLQVAQNVYRADLLNRWQRLLCWVSGHGEGWALYAERLMADLGYLDDPADRLGMLMAQSFRAARVIVDIGLHLELPIPTGAGFHDGEVWTPELAFEFLVLNAPHEKEFLTFELDRYLGWPGQAPSYKVGERIWLQAREETRARKGDAFDVKEFHRQALNLGSLGLDPLRAALARL